MLTHILRLSAQIIILTLFTVTTVSIRRKNNDVWQYLSQTKEIVFTLVELFLSYQDAAGAIEVQCCHLQADLVPSTFYILKSQCGPMGNYSYIKAAIWGWQSNNLSIALSNTLKGSTGYTLMYRL